MGCPASSRAGKSSCSPRAWRPQPGPYLFPPLRTARLARRFSSSARLRSSRVWRRSASTRSRSRLARSRSCARAARRSCPFTATAGGSRLGLGGRLRHRCLHRRLGRWRRGGLLAPARGGLGPLLLLQLLTFQFGLLSLGRPAAFLLLGSATALIPFALAALATALGLLRSRRGDWGPWGSCGGGGLGGRRWGYSRGLGGRAMRWGGSDLWGRRLRGRRRRAQRGRVWRRRWGLMSRGCRHRRRRALGGLGRRSRSPLWRLVVLLAAEPEPAHTLIVACKASWRSRQPRVQLHQARTVAQRKRRRCSRSTSRCWSRSRISRRRSPCSLPRASASSTLAHGPLKYTRVGIRVSPRRWLRPISRSISMAVKK